jgi:acyl-coenzyme A synthetase/AMP-(fatty) acid ligase
MCRGDKIPPMEVDGVLLSHPAISEAVSFAVPDEMYGQEIHCAVVLKSPVTEDELKFFAGETLAKFKVPKKIYITKSIPKTATGKVQRGKVSQTFFKPPVKAKL